MSLSLQEARDRAAQITVRSYDIEIDLREDEWFSSTVEVTFDFTRPHHSTFLELTDAQDLEVETSPARITWDYTDGRLYLHDLDSVNTITVRARLSYVTDGEGMHTFTDPVDGATYRCALTSLDVTQRVFACFDQPDMKAPLSLRVLAPKSVSVIANGALASVAGTDTYETWTFATTPPLSTYLFTLCAGPWTTREWEHDGVPMAWHARASQSDALDRDFEELRSITERCFDRYTAMFDEPFPFRGYDQVFVQGLNWGAMEFPGCVVYRDELLPPQAPTAPVARFRAAVIAHEMAHMWFGDLATMRWWEGTWLNESFADFMGVHIGEGASGHTGLLVDFTVEKLPAAYAADSRRSSHPVAVRAEDVPDVDTSRGNFDALTYTKGNALLRQLVVWLGEESFLRGANAYLSKYAWRNATLDDFLTCLDDATERDVRGWADAWLTTTGFDTLRVERHASHLTVHRDGVRPHRCTVARFDEAWNVLDQVQLDLDDEAVTLESAAYVVPNAAGETFAVLALDDATQGALGDGLRLIADPLTRAVLWGHVCEQVRRGRASTLDAFGLMATALPHEEDVAIVASMITWALDLPLNRWTNSAEIAPAEALLAETCAKGLASNVNARLGAEFARGLAKTTVDSTLLETWLAEGYADGPAGIVAVDTKLRWLALTRLARLGAIDRQRIDSEQGADGTQQAVIAAISARAAQPSAAAREDAWAILTDPNSGNRAAEAAAVGLWDRRDVAAMSPYVERYLRDVPALAARTPAAAKLLGKAFPALPLSDTALALVDAALLAGVPTVLQRAWQDHRDDIDFPRLGGAIR